MHTHPHTHIPTYPPTHAHLHRALSFLVRLLTGPGAGSLVCSSAPTSSTAWCHSPARAEPFEGVITSDPLFRSALPALVKFATAVWCRDQHSARSLAKSETARNSPFPDKPSMSVSVYLQAAFTQHMKYESNPVNTIKWPISTSQ